MLATKSLGSTFIDRSDPEFYSKIQSGQLTFVYQPGYLVSDLELSHDSLLRCYIPRIYLTPSNHSVRTRQVWGTTVYSEDSDLVAVLLHSGAIKLSYSHPCNFSGMAVTLLIQQCHEFPGSVGHGIESRSLIIDDQTDIDIFGMSIVQSNALFSTSNCNNPSFLPNIAFSWSLTCEPCLTYSNSVFIDEPYLRISEKLLNSILYFEDLRHRYELCYRPAAQSHNFFEEGKMILSRVKVPQKWTRSRLRSSKLPLFLEGEAEVLAEDYFFNFFSVQVQFLPEAHLSFIRSNSFGIIVIDQTIC
ncbi:hypothetical protein GEMRC1_011236 [Eukaryota sp. GEM-RC1]